MTEGLLTTRLAHRLRELRRERGLSLESLADLSGVGRSTLSRIENGEVSPSAEVLGRLCAAHALTMSRLLAMVEDEFTALVERDRQPTWQDPETGFVRRSLSPPSKALAAEVVECELAPGTGIAYPEPPVAGLEHHLVMRDGALTATVGGHAYELGPGDCLRYRLFGASRFDAGAARGARYLLVLV